MDIIIGSLEGAIRGGIDFLTQRRSRPGAAPYLKRTAAPLFVEFLSLLQNDLGRRHFLKRMRVSVRCATWHDTNVVLDLSNSEVDGWLVWGDIKILYGADYPIPAHKSTYVHKAVEPRFKDDGTMQYRLSSPNAS